MNFDDFFKVAFPEIRLHGTMNFDGPFDGFGVVFNGVYDTMNPEDPIWLIFGLCKRL